MSRSTITTFTWFTCGIGHDMDGPFIGLRSALQTLGRKSATFLFAGAYKVTEHTDDSKYAIYIFTRQAASRLGFEVKECDWLEQEEEQLAAEG